MAKAASQVAAEARPRSESGSAPVVGILMGSDSDWPVMEQASKTLTEFGVPHEARVLSAHRNPEKVRDYARGAAGRGMRVIICGAGGAAHLAGVTAAATILPVIGVPVESKSLKGLDSLLSTVQMPKGIPVATVAIDGAANAAILAVECLALSDAGLRKKLVEHKQKLADSNDTADRGLQAKIKGA
jgi:5-(carboxyamino)imidazole ribonucleotide mutase